MLRPVFSAMLITGLAITTLAAQNDRRINNMISRQDSDKDGKISKQEWRWRKENFDKIDINKDGYITADELQKSLSGLRRPVDADIIKNVTYATVGGKKMLLDIYMPKNSKKPPVLLVWIHGGGWRNGSKNNVNRSFLDLVKEGYAVASIDYQLLGVPGIPQITYECKSAIRFLRANAKKYGYNADRIGIGGSSAGGHLVLLLGTSGGVKKLEGEVGGNLDQSSSVQAVVDFFGPSDMLTQPKVKQQLTNKVFIEFARLISPVVYVDKNDPPLLIYHGTADRTVPIQQSRIIYDKYKELGLEVTKHEIEGAGHGFKPAELPPDKATKEMKEFFDKHLLK